MSGRSVEHASFVVERKYEVSPERAFAAWADPEAKARWYSDSEAHLELDFRVGGREHSSGSAPDGRAYRYEALFHDIVAAQRIVYAYDMFLDGTRISVSLATVEFTAAGDSGTHMVFTEQGAFLDGHESPAGRAEGMGSLLDALEKELQAIPRVPERQPSFDWHIALVRHQARGQSALTPHKAGVPREQTCSGRGRPAGV